MSANLRLRTIAALYVLIAVLSALFTIMWVSSTNTDYGFSEYEIVMIFGSIAIIAGSLGGGLWCLKNIARWLLFGVHVVFGLISLFILFQGTGIGLGITLLTINGAITLVLFFSEPKPGEKSEAPFDTFLAKIGSQLRSALWFMQTDAWVSTWPNTRLRIVAVVYLLAAVLSLLVLFLVLLQGDTDHGLMRYQVVLLFVGFSLINIALGVGLWKLKEAARWLAIGVHVLFGLLSVVEVMHGNNSSFILMTLTLNSMIAGLLFFSKPTLWYEI